MTLFINVTAWGTTVYTYGDLIVKYRIDRLGRPELEHFTIYRMTMIADPETHNRIYWERH